jgi:hypothetical protein
LRGSRLLNIFGRIGAVLLIASVFLSSPVFAATSRPAPPTPNGLFISPASDFTSLNAGSSKNGSFIIGNYTSAPITVILNIKQFTVVNYTYSYQFSNPVNNWITLGLNEATLLPDQNLKVPYQISVPKGAAPGGNYYTLFASTIIQTGSLKSTIQAASLLYLTVNGKLIRSSRLEHSSMPQLMFGQQLSFRFDVLNTGNVYYFVFVSGKLSGFTAGPPSTASAHILIPGKIRGFSGSIVHPLLPGIYKASYGYVTDNGNHVNKSQLIAYIPPWSIALALVIILGVLKWLDKKKRTKS